MDGNLLTDWWFQIGSLDDVHITAISIGPWSAGEEDTGSIPPTIRARLCKAGGPDTCVHDSSDPDSLLSETKHETADHAASALGTFTQLRLSDLLEHAPLPAETRDGFP